MINMYSEKGTLSLAMIVFMLCSYSLAEFTEVPFPMTLEIGSGPAIFRCRHPSATAISWRVNNSSIKIFPDITSGIIHNNDGLVYTLSIPARSEYNGTEIVCLAFFISGSPESTPPVFLLLTVTQSLTPLPPTMEPGFEVTPSPLNVTVEQEIAVFYCQHRSSYFITWRVNGTFLNSLDATIEMVSRSSGNSTSLSVATFPGYNQTTIECVAVFLDGSPHQFTPPVILLVQGIPGNISNFGYRRNYSSGVLTIFWDPLPTLDLTGIHPDIIYRVEIYKTTCGQSVSMADKNVTESIANNTLELMETYTTFVIPRNNVPGYTYGPRAVMEETFMPLKGKTLFELNRRPPINVRNDKPVPSYYIMMLESLDGIGGNLRLTISVQSDGEMITMQIGEPLPPKHLWTASILPYDCKADMQVTELSTHDIQNVVVSSSFSQPGQISVMGDFVDGSIATGVLLIVYSLTNESEIQYIYIAKQPEQNYIHKNMTVLAGTEYGVSVFALEDGLPFPRVVTAPRNVFVANNHQVRTPQQPTSIEFKLHPTSTGVCVNCTFLDGSTTDCVAVVHQRISQLNSSGLMNIKSSHKFTRSRNRAQGCIEGVNLEQYQVGVIGAKVISPTVKSNDKETSQAGAIAGAGVVTAIAVTVIVLVIGIALYMYLYLRRHKTTTQEPVYSEVPPSLQYETIVGQLYALTQLESTSKGALDDLHVVVYSEIRPQPKTQGEEATSLQLTSEQTCTCRTDTPPANESITVDLLVSHLLPYASKWQSLGLALSLDDDRLDEIFTNNETDEACLRGMLEMYMQIPVLDHSWEKIEAAERKVKEGAVDQQPDDNEAEVTLRKSGNDQLQPGGMAFSDNSTPDLGYLSQSMPSEGEGCELQCGSSALGDLSAGNFQARIQEQDWSRNLSVVSGLATFPPNMCASTQCRKTSHIPDNATDVAATCGYEEAFEEKDVYNSNCDASHNLGQSGNSFGDKQSDKESIQQGYGLDNRGTELSDLAHSIGDATSYQEENSEWKLATTSTEQPGSSECEDAASNASGDDFSDNQDEYYSNHTYPSGIEAAQRNVSVALYIPMGTDPTKNKDSCRENNNDNRLPSNIFDVEILCTCSSMNSYYCSQLKKFGLVVAEDCQDNEGPCKLDPVYCQESSNDRTKINYETSLRKFFKIETIDKVMDKRSYVVKISEGVVEELNEEMKDSESDIEMVEELNEEVIKKLNEEKINESSIEMVEGSDEVVEIVELCNGGDAVEEAVGEHIDQKSHGEHVELCEVQSRLSKRQLVVCCGSWKPVKNSSLTKGISYPILLSNDTVSKATESIHDEICMSHSIPCVQKAMKLRFSQGSQPFIILFLLACMQSVCSPQLSTSTTSLDLE